MFGLSKIFKRWARKTRGSITITSDGFEVSRTQQGQKVRWNDVIKIEVFRIPGLVVEDFCAAFFSDAAEPLVVDDIFPDFVEFQEAVWQRWPEIKDRWITIYLGSPDERERAVLWEAQKA